MCDDCAASQARCVEHRPVSGAMFVRSLNSKRNQSTKTEKVDFGGKKSLMTARKGRLSIEHSLPGNGSIHRHHDQIIFLCPVGYLLYACMQGAQLRRTLQALTPRSWPFLGVSWNKKETSTAATALAHSQITTCISRVAVMFVRY